MLTFELVHRFCRWQHIDYFDNKDTLLPQLLLLDNIYLQMHSVKQGSSMDTFEALGLPTASEVAWTQCEYASQAVAENRGVMYHEALNLTSIEDGTPLPLAVLDGIEFSNATSVMGVSRDAHAGRDLDAEANSWDWREVYPPRMQGPNSYSAAAANWYHSASLEDARMQNSAFDNWFEMHQAADRAHFEMIANGTIPTDRRRTLGGNLIGGPRYLRKRLKLPVVEMTIDRTVPSLAIESEVRAVTFSLEVSGADNTLEVSFEAEGCLQEVLCLTGGLSTDTLPTRRFTITVSVALKVSNKVDAILSPLPGLVKDPLVKIVETVFDKELGSLEYKYYRSARIHEKWERINVCAPCHLLKAQLNVYTGNGFLDLHFRGFIRVAAVYAPKFHAMGVWKKHKKDELWGVTDQKKHLYIQGLVGFEYRIPGIGYIAGWKTGWETKIFEASLWDGSASWWSSSTKRSRVDNKLSKAWDYRYGWGNNDKVDQFYN